MINLPLGRSRLDPRRTPEIVPSASSPAPPYMRPHHCFIELFFPALDQHREIFDFCMAWMCARSREVGSDLPDIQLSHRTDQGPARIELHTDEGDLQEHLIVSLDVEPHPLDGDLGVRAVVQRKLTFMLCQNDARQDRSPELVQALTRSFGAHRDKDVLPVARTCGREAVPDLATYLLDPGRALPVLVISALPSRSAAAVDADAVAQEVAGLAHVYRLPDDRATAAFCADLPAAYQCFGGAVRLYETGLAKDDFDDRHRLWAPHDLTVHGQDRFLSDLVGELLPLWVERAAPA